ncbi:MAG: hypothetical protein LBU05_05400, partial [Bifidobacteriaceae bacterium]|nr:hypothetical protein [Bifidobacteriaceae bacterium]
TDESGYVNTISANQREAVAGLPGVSAAVGVWEVMAQIGPDGSWQCDPVHEFCHFDQVFVGSCAELLAFNPDARNCSDDEIRWIEPVGARPNSFENGELIQEQRPDADTLVLRLGYGADQKPAEFALAAAVISVPPWPERLDGVRWHLHAGLFVPRALAAALGEPHELKVLIDQGGLAAQRALAAAVQPLGLVAMPEDLAGYREAAVLLTGFWGLIALAMAVALLNLAITAVDRAKERRQIVARQVALGVPGRVLWHAQTLQVAVPLVSAVALGAVGGGAALLCYWLPDHRSGRVDWPWPQLTLALGAVLVGSALVVALTIRLTRLRLTPELLRRE